MKRILRLQVSLFGEFERIGDDETVVSDAAELMEIFGRKLIPDLMQLLTPNTGGHRQQHNCLRMRTPDSTLSITFLPGRIDSTFVGRDTDADVSTMNDILRMLGEQLTKSLQHLGLTGNRLAANGQFADEDSELNAASFLRPRPFYQNVALEEWSVDCNRLLPVSILGQRETTNNILNVSRRQEAQNKSFLLVTFDVNTRYEQTQMRFGPDAVDPFLAEITPNLDSMLEGLK